MKQENNLLLKIPPIKFGGVLDFRIKKWILLHDGCIVRTIKI